MAGLLVVRSRNVSAERQKGQVQGGNPNWGAGGTQEKPWLHQMLYRHLTPTLSRPSSCPAGAEVSSVIWDKRDDLGKAFWRRAFVLTLGRVSWHILGSHGLTTDNMLARAAPR